MKRVTMGHGAGGEMMQELIRAHIIPFLPMVRGEVPLQSFDDSAVVDDIVFTTDGHTVKPLFFPGGDIGSLSVCGTVNDISVMGGQPIAISCSMILEEGLEIDILEKVAKSIGESSRLCGVPVATGDTKVMESGKIERMVIATAGIGRRSPFLDHDIQVASGYRKVDSRWMTDDNLRAGDKVIVTGTLGDHGIALLSFREGYGFESEVRSDIAPMNSLVEDILKVGGAVCMKDPTRGGMANAVNEWSSKSKIGMEIDEASIPISDAVRNACELLGLDPLSIGNEGKMIIGVVPDMAEDVLKAIKRHRYGRNAAIIGSATHKIRGVVLRTEVGGRRILEPPIGDPVPRIC